MSTARWWAHGFNTQKPQAMMGEARATTRETPPAGPKKIETPLTMIEPRGARSPASRDRLKRSPSMPWILKRTTIAVITSECLRVIMFCMFYSLLSYSLHHQEICERRTPSKGTYRPDFISGFKDRCRAGFLRVPSLQCARCPLIQEDKERQP